ncbi:uncharacterized protein LOC135173002 [Diachasmimorpha longicaudata]|uniref:uncharacterized protein LOC135173002 n=1 Tax=Diachasmimorpha longicaudata TaxID=58733 RepID=UPI0030B8828A
MGHRVPLDDSPLRKSGQSGVAWWGEVTSWWGIEFLCWLSHRRLVSIKDEAEHRLNISFPSEAEQTPKTIKMMTKCLILFFAFVAVCSAGAIVPAAVPAALTVGTYASSYNAHSVNHAYAAPYVAAPAVAAPALAYSSYGYAPAAYSAYPFAAPIIAARR